MKRILSVAVYSSGLFAVSYAWPVSKALAFAVLAVLYLYLAWSIVWDLREERKKKR